MTITNVENNHIIGFKYIGFGGLKKAQKGLKPFEGTKPGNKTAINLFLTPKTNKTFKIAIWLDGPWDNAIWKVPSGLQCRQGSSDHSRGHARPQMS